MEEVLIKKGDAEEFVRWVEEYANEDFASLLDEAEKITRRIKLR